MRTVFLAKLVGTVCAIGKLQDVEFETGIKQHIRLVEKQGVNLCAGKAKGFGRAVCSISTFAFLTRRFRAASRTFEQPLKPKFSDIDFSNDAILVMTLSNCVASVCGNHVPLTPKGTRDERRFGSTENSVNSGVLNILDALPRLGLNRSIFSLR